MVFLQIFLVLIPICSFSMVSSTAISTNTSAVAEDFGILVIGGDPSYASRSVEFWSNPEEGTCQLNDYPRGMRYGPTANLVSGQLVACFQDSCEIYNGGGEWTHLVNTSSRRHGHNSAVKDNRILLIGGVGLNSTEWISVDGSPSQPGPFHVRHGCTIQLSSDLIVLTGGQASDLVTRYQLTGNGDETPLTPMNQGRGNHACGVYLDAGGQQVLLVSGGSNNGSSLSSTEVAVYSSGSQLEWREVQGGQLPSPRQGLRSSLIGDVLFVTGGRDHDDNRFTSILSWDPVAEYWQQAGDLAVARAGHAAVAVPTSLVECAVAEDFGILVIGGRPSAASVEFWSNPEEGSCQLNDYPREMNDGPTVNLVSGQLVTCYGDSCEIYNGGGEWTHLVDISRGTRKEHSSAVTDDDRILLIGGVAWATTEYISVDGSPSQPGPYGWQHGERHCTIQLSSDLIVVTGGEDTPQLVTRYRLSEGDGDPTPLVPTNPGGFMDKRYGHACGVYQRAGGQQVLLNIGGSILLHEGPVALSSTEVAVYSSCQPDAHCWLDWREVEGGQLPSPRTGLRATLVGDILFVTGGRDDGAKDLTSILSWDPVAYAWQQAGDLAVGRSDHAAVAVSKSVIGAC